MRTRRRNRSLKKGGAEEITIEQQLNGLHLHADVEHDFGVVNPPYYIQHPEFTISTMKNEDVVSDFFKTDPQNIIPLRQQRLEYSTKFTNSFRTESFQEWKKNCLSSVGNSVVGIVHDAGTFVADTFGAYNLITFGSIIDPACKPLSEDQHPIYFKNNENTRNRLYLKLVSFGFDPNIIDAVMVKDLKMDKVSCVFYTPQVVYDATNPETTTKNIGEESDEKIKKLSQKPINYPSGFLTSIAKAIKQTDIKYKIGKSLGDTLLVVSAMPKLPTNDGKGVFDNPYLTEGKWVDENQKEVVPQPQVAVLKTIDRLNHIRAFIKGVPSILEQPKNISKKRPNDSTQNSNAKKQKGGEIITDKALEIVSRCEFIPGLPTNENELAKKLEETIISTKNKFVELYDTLINELQSCIENGNLKKEVSKLSQGKDAVIQTDLGLELAGNLFTEKLIPGVEIIKFKVLLNFYDILDEFDATPNVSEKIRISSKANRLFTLFSPKRTSIFTDNKVIYEDGVILANIPKKSPVLFGDKEFSGSIKIVLHDLFKYYYGNIKPEDNGNPDITSSKLYKFFLSVFDETDFAEGKLTTDYKELIPLKKEEVVKEKVRNKLNKTVLKNREVSIDQEKITKELEDNSGKAEDYAVGNHNQSIAEEYINEENTPTLNLFVKYCITTFGTSLQRATGWAVAITKQLHNGAVFLDDYLSRNIAREVELAGQQLSQKGGENGKKDYAICVFNAFVCYVNKQNARVFGYVDDEIVIEDNAISEEYGLREQLYLKMIREVRKSVKINIVSNPVENKLLTYKTKSSPNYTKRNSIPRDTGFYNQLPLSYMYNFNQPTTTTQAGGTRRTFRRKHSRRNKQ